MTRSRTPLLLPILALAALIGGRAQAQTWWNQDYSKRIPITITNPGTTATPNPTSAEALIPNDPAMRPDRADVRVVYFNGTTQTEIDSKVFRDPPPFQALYQENANAGTTAYSSLPAGTKLTPLIADDASTTVTLPFNFPFRNGVTPISTNQITITPDGYLSPGSTDPGRPDKGTNGAAKQIIMPFQSDFAATESNEGVYFFADATQAVIRWEVQESTGSPAPIIAKFAVILKPDGTIRFVYGTPVNAPSAAVADPATGYDPVRYGIGVGDAIYSIIHDTVFPADFSNHPDILYTPTGATPGTDAARVVFRLQQPIPAGGSSTGQYFVYYGNSSPATDAKHDIKNVFDTYIDFASLPVDQPAPNWTSGTADEQVIVRDWQGKRVGVLEYKSAAAGSTFNHAQAWVKDGAMPKYGNLEALGHIAPYGGGELEQALVVRVPQAAGDPNQGGGYAYATDAFGTFGADHLVSYVNPIVARGPADMASGPPRRGHISAYENIDFRVEGELLTGKAWKDYEPEPLYTFDKVDRTTLHPQHNNTDDPIYSAPGGVGLATYIQPVAVDYIAIRELRTTFSTGAVQTNTATGDAIRGTVTSSAGGPVAGATVTISNGTTTTTVITDASGKYMLTVPAGTYSVAVSAPGFTPATQSGVSPTASGQTNFNLVSVGVTISGVVRGFPDNGRVVGAHVVLVDSAGKIAADTRTSATGAYSLVAPGPGTYSVGALETPILTFPNNTARGTRATVTVGSAPVTQNLLMGDVMNGDFEIPNPDYNSPEGWEGYRYGGLLIPNTQYQYTTAQNHTPGGHYSIALKDTHSFNAWMTSIPFFPFPAVNGNFNRHISVWWYPTAVDQKMDVFIRPFNSANASLGDQLIAKVADATMINKWNEVTADVAANPALTQMSIRFRGEDGTPGLQYFDDLTITATPVAQVFGKVLDENGAPVANAYVGVLTNAGGLSDPTLLDAPVVPTDENGDYHFYASTADPVTLAAWVLPTPVHDLVLPPFGYVMGTAAVTPSANPTAPVNLTVKRAANVLKGATLTAVDTGSNNRAGDTSMPPANAVDDNWATRFATSQPNPNNPAITLTFDMGTAKTIDEVDLFWELALPGDYDLYAGTSTDPTADTLIFSSASNADADKHGLFGVNYSPFTEGPIHAFKTPAPINARYIIIVTRAFSGSLGNLSIIEARALSLAAPLPLSTADVTRALEIAGGLAVSTAGDKARLDKDGDGKITLLDAVKINKAVNGL